MSKGGSTQTQNSNSTTSTNIDPWYMANGQSNYQEAKKAIDEWNPTLRSTPAGFTEDQLKAFQLTNDASTGSPMATYALGRASANNEKLANNPIGTYTYDPYTTSDARMAQLMKPISDYKFNSPQSILGSGPVSIGGFGGASVGGIKDVVAKQIEAAKINRGDIRDVTAGYTPDELQKYLDAMDPSYTQAVLDASMNDLNRSRQIQLQQDAAKAAAAGAFGGSRHGVTESETNKDFLNQAASTSANLRLNYFNTALNTLQQDFARRLQADQGNQQVDYNTAAQNANLLQGANIANQGADLEAQKGNQATSAQVAITNAQLAQQAGMAQAQLQAQAAIQYQQLLAQLGLANENNRAQFALDLVKGGLGVEADNAKALNNAGQWNAGQKFDTDKANADYLNKSIANDQSFVPIADTSYWTGVKNLLANGNQQQQFNQSVLDTNDANKMATNSAALTKAFLRQQALAGTPYNTSTTSTGDSTTKVQQTASPLGIASSLAGMFLMSDKRLKTNVKTMASPLQSLHKMKGVSYNWKPGAGPNGGGPDAGLLAQDVEQAVPGGAQDIGGIKHYSVPHVLGLLTESVKELDKKVSKKEKKARA